MFFVTVTVLLNWLSFFMLLKHFIFLLNISSDGPIQCCRVTPIHRHFLQHLCQCFVCLYPLRFKFHSSCCHYQLSPYGIYKHNCHLILQKKALQTQLSIARVSALLCLLSSLIMVASTLLYCTITIGMALSHNYIDHSKRCWITFHHITIN